MEEETLKEANEEENKQDDANQCDKDEPEIESLKQKIEELETKASDFEEKYLRAYAESENIRKRADKERRDIIRFANKELLNNLLSFMDNFDRALQSVEEEDEMKNNEFYKGIELISKSFSSFLDTNSVEEIKSLGEEFDPNIHEALSAIDSPDVKTDTVVQVYAKGYTLNGELLRAAKVIIGKPISEKQ